MYSLMTLFSSPCQSQDGICLRSLPWEPVRVSGGEVNKNMGAFLTVAPRSFSLSYWPQMQSPAIGQHCHLSSYQFMAQPASAPGKQILAVIVWICLQILIWLFATRPSFSGGSEKYLWFSFIQLFLVVRTAWRPSSFFPWQNWNPKSLTELMDSLKEFLMVLERLCHFLNFYSPPFQQASLTAGN